MKKRILVVDDEKHIVEFLEMNLRKNGYEPLHAYDGENAILLAKSEQPDCILLDLMLPVINGLETCRRIKQDPVTTKIPIIMLTAKSEENDKVIGLGVGADDYVTKPFGLRELFARIEVVLRRANDSKLFQPSYSDVITFKDITLNVKGHLVEKGGERVDLTKTEFELLHLLARNINSVLTREELIQELEVSHGDSAARSLDVHIRNLRKKIEDNISENRYIETIRGVGFKLNN